MKPIARIHTDFSSKFGLPRQSGMVDELVGRVVLEPKFSHPDVFRGLDGFSHVWLIWKFNSADDEWTPTVRPPQLGGNKRVGVFASRSPFRPNSLGLSCVKIIDINSNELTVSGIDMMDGTEIYDIKPYIPYSDCINDAKSGFSNKEIKKLNVIVSDKLLSNLPQDKHTALIKALEVDPRPQYHSDPERIYGFIFAGCEVKFSVKGNELIIKDIYKKECFK